MALPTLRIPRDLGAARTNLRDKLQRKPIADLRQTPRELVERTEPAVTHLLDLVTGSPDADLVQAPGGHLGVLTGRAARTTTWPDMEEFYVRHDG